MNDTSTNSNSARVVIAGEEYIIKGDTNSETIARIAEYVNEKILEVGSGVSSKERYKIAILTAVNIAGELFDARRELLDNSDKMDQILFKAKELSEKLESTLT
ncbi:MAG: hypothetical protein A2268_09410 [Candidatus Raymondbacteria bacterium RifOxyA12_full_50_37]|uniref:Cell division protein ZapA n=1 Tax=Candidatus Raymondbacteria bacterium RIFOXYD12_FULL_49_13 TaxID=1817890 RepID=A0A1F7F188_UNCRA|nr:MAG: hypothetical protein A2350_09100 [Candidatus Raymondbacteria bacterium RifOxyB12_full_50_8]OGJ90852.1 MAG: hypothetical protein A2268_09410 [Candidatus Raymondbacteria bacterium RifOxyA12_full_50_37]OGJ93941.1 MAG: hypothetical protein A2248_06885 [Candidatus Raymondbacteria bacterium RIFOXYA2_FULL_49_16]OGJ94711.1 MAG: hypothetical protein A2487_07895 [Candidatus Raymondbacteria bacterium RifOxyC12_full_50_8]OGJ98190.1 MAG: hypothetical protein A2453_00280 [Candidatus Raymondbacteria b